MELQSSKSGRGGRPTSQNHQNNKNLNKDSAFSSSSAASNMKNNASKATMAQYNADAKLMAEFEQSSVSSDPLTIQSQFFMDRRIEYPHRMLRKKKSLLIFQEFRGVGLSNHLVVWLLLRNPFKIRTLFTPSSGDSLARSWLLGNFFVEPYIWVHSRSQKLAVRSISRLQSLPGGDIGILCDTAVEDVQKLTGYDRVMVYKFHDDNHGEIVSEIRRSDLDPIGSPHDCHIKYMTNMGSISSLVMAVLINSGDSMKLWGLAFALQLNMELQLASQLAEKKTPNARPYYVTCFFEMFHFGIVTQSPMLNYPGAALLGDAVCGMAVKLLQSFLSGLGLTQQRKSSGEVLSSIQMIKMMEEKCPGLHLMPFLK
ncbi:hypothetical protein HAX54_034998 [Datura stramonium]|uniref:Phytochrome chromophore attachment site domain-containing protein n=1 Tax=Datura stramonium TaxID=4076 RepID=A0ABS8SEZ1_DATST|nr:hypothetical protein [Datura stramonium]